MKSPAATGHAAAPDATPMLDRENAVFALCAAGMAAGGDTAAAADHFARAWAARTDDVEAAVAAHYVARVQPTAAEKLAWDARAARHAEAAEAGGDARARGLLASLYLNLADGLLAAGRRTEAHETAARAEGALAALPDDGYRAFVATGVARLHDRLRVAEIAGEAQYLLPEPSPRGDETR